MSAVIWHKEAEQSVIGVILIQPELLDSIHAILPDYEMFSAKSHQVIYKAILSLWKNGNVIDAITLKNQLNGTNEMIFVDGGIMYISSLMNSASGGNYIQHCMIVKEHSMRREMIRISQEAISQCYDKNADILKLQDKIINDIEKVSTIKKLSKMQTIDDIKRDFINSVRNAKDPTSIKGLFSGIKAFDDILLGYRPGGLYIVAARPGMGKTSFVKSVLVHNCIENNKIVLIFSLEMTSLQLMKALVSEISRINSTKFTKGNINVVEEQAMMNALARIKNNIIIDDTAKITIRGMRRKIAKYKRIYGNIEMIMIDYIQIMGDDSNKGNREQDVAYNSGELKAIAKEEGVPMIALSQLSRKVEERKPPRPILSDLRESGSIENDADTIVFIYRPEYYGFTEDSDGNSLIGVAELITAKNREGNLGTAKVKFIKEYTQFTDLIKPEDSPQIEAF